MLTVGDVIFNDHFDFNANYAVYKCKPNTCWNENEPIVSTLKDGYNKPLDAILDMKIDYMTISDNILIIEASEQSS